MGGRMAFDFTFGGRSSRSRRRHDDESPFRLLLVGDFSGRASARARGERKALRRPLMVDAGDIDRAVATFAPTLRLPAPGVGGATGSEETASFASIDDLHPDALFRRLSSFQAPRGFRAALAGPSPGEEAFAAAEVWLRQQNGGGDVAATAAGAAATPSSESSESTQSTLERLLGRSGAAPRAAETTDAAGALGSLLGSAVQSHLTPDVGARRAMLLSAVDEALTAQMRALLATPQFRALEGAWRGAERVIRALDTDGELKIGLLDACKQDLADALGGGGGGAGGDLERSELHRLMIEEDRGWSVIAVDLTFDLALPDLQLLAALGAVAARAGAPLLADAAPALLGSSSLAGLADPTTWGPPQGVAGDEVAAPFWQALRQSPLGPSIGLALPRVLGRLPYGKKTDPAAVFAFEELTIRAGARPEHRVWTAAAFALAQLLGAAFREHGWQLDPDAQLDLLDLPAHTYDADGEPQLVPSTEVALGERAATAVRARGLIPLLARRDRAEARLMGTSSIADPARALAGAWSERDGDGGGDSDD